MNQRSIGDASWLNDYIGIPYQFGGRTREGLDCYGLVKLIYSEQYDEALPDWVTDVIDMRVRHREFENAITSGDFIQKDEPIEGDFVICYRARAAHHMGLFYAGGVIHSVDGSGVVFEPLSRFSKQYTKLTYGEWHPCP